MDVKSLEKTAVNTWLRTVRLPLSTVEVALRRTEHAWPPSVLFEGFEAFVRDTAGTVLRNDDLKDQARLQRAEVNQRRKAMQKRAEAEEIRQTSQAEFEEKRRSAEQAQQRAEQEAAQREQQLERERAQAKARLEQETAKREAAAQELEDRRQKALDEKAREARTTQLDAEEKALREKERALRAKDQAAKLDEAVEQTKQERKASR